MFHVFALIVAAVMYLVYGIYRFHKPAQRRSWKLAAYVLGAVVAWYEVQMFWYWVLLGAVLIVLAMFDKSASETKTVAQNGKIPFGLNDRTFRIDEENVLVYRVYKRLGYIRKCSRV